VPICCTRTGFEIWQRHASKRVLWMFSVKFYFCFLPECCLLFFPASNIKWIS
jgi:hypothetical protein